MLDCTAFVGMRLIASGPLPDVARAAKPFVDRAVKEPVLLFDSVTSHVVDVDFRGSADDVVSRIMPAATGPGRPKLGVVGREVTLLPRHWEWLNGQPGGASVALRRCRGVRSVNDNPCQRTQLRANRWQVCCAAVRESASREQRRRASGGLWPIINVGHAVS